MKTKRTTSILAICVSLLVMAAGTHADIITGASDNGTGSQLVAGGFDEGVLAFVDRDYEWVSAPGHTTIADMGLVGADYIKLANDDKTLTDYTLNVTFGQNANVFLFWDERGSVNSWVTDLGFTDSGDRVIGLDALGSTYNHIVLTANLPAGTYIFEELNQGNNRSMYGIAAVPVPGALLLGLLGLGAAAARLRKRG